MQILALAQVDTSTGNFLFPESLGEILSNPRKDNQMVYTLKE